MDVLCALEKKAHAAVAECNILERSTGHAGLTALFKSSVSLLIFHLLVQSIILKGFETSVYNYGFVYFLFVVPSVFFPVFLSSAID